MIQFSHYFLTQLTHRYSAHSNATLTHTHTHPTQRLTQPTRYGALCAARRVCWEAAGEERCPVGPDVSGLCVETATGKESAGRKGGRRLAPPVCSRTHERQSTRTQVTAVIRSVCRSQVGRAQQEN